MVLEQFGRSLVYSPEQMFDLAADIERYPEFLKGWISARIQSRQSNVLTVDQIVGFGPIRLEFISQAALHRPDRIDISSTDQVFRKYSLCWLVAASPPGSRISITAQIELKSRLLQRLVNQFLPGSLADIVAAFEARAQALYAVPDGD